MDLTGSHEEWQSTVLINWPWTTWQFTHKESGCGSESRQPTWQVKNCAENPANRFIIRAINLEQVRRFHSFFTTGDTGGSSSDPKPLQPLQDRVYILRHTTVCAQLCSQGIKTPFIGMVRFRTDTLKWTRRSFLNSLLLDNFGCDPSMSGFIIAFLQADSFRAYLSACVQHTMHRMWVLHGWVGGRVLNKSPLAYSDEKWLYYKFSLHHSYNRFWKVGRIHFLSSGVKGLRVRPSITRWP